MATGRDEKTAGYFGVAAYLEALQGFQKKDNHIGILANASMAIFHSFLSNPASLEGFSLEN